MILAVISIIWCSVCVILHWLCVESVTLDAAFMESRMRDFCLSASNNYPTTSQNETKELSKKNENYIEKSAIPTSGGMHHKWRSISSYYSSRSYDGYCRVRPRKIKLKSRKKELSTNNVAIVDYKTIHDSPQMTSDSFIDTVFSLIER